MIWIILSLLLSALFSGIEIAFISANKLRIELSKNEGSRVGKILGQFYEKPTQFISMLLVGNNIALVVFSTLMANKFIPSNYSFLPENKWLIIYQTALSTLLVLLLGEFLPKALFRSNAYILLRYVAWPLKYFVQLPLKPFTYVTVKLSERLIQLFTKTKNVAPDKADAFSMLDLAYLVKENSDIITADDEPEEDTDENVSTDEMFERVLELNDVKIRECMVPRTETKAIDKTATIEKLTELIVETMHSRILVYNEDLDHIEGYVHHHSLYSEPTDISSIMFDILKVPETMSALDLLSQFRKQQKSIAVVIDEYGGTAGVVTIEDLMEEIFGEIVDEHDKEEYIDKEIQPGIFILSARFRSRLFE